MQTDTLAPAPITGAWVDSRLNATQRLYCHIANNTVTAVVIDRVTGMTVSTQDITASSTSPTEPSVINCGNTTAIIYRDAITLALTISFWTGTTWTAPDTFGTANAYDVAAITGGIRLVWQDGSLVITATYQDSTAQFPFVSTLISGGAPTGCIALAVAPDDTFGVAYLSSSGMKFKEFTSTGSATGYALAAQAALTGDRGLSLVSRKLPNPDGSWNG